ncbi:MAG TPA: hypothetical protein DDZ68_07905 [Parvularcula sp.]|nr:hypothetical protein [Parvularcula sp.]HBS32816.1 hypothetical protein [Parvularcula sp.]
MALARAGRTLGDHVLVRSGRQALERVPKSAKRFSDKTRGRTKGWTPQFRAFRRNYADWPKSCRVLHDAPR